jgi:hypothetical protein
MTTEDLIMRTVNRRANRDHLDTGRRGDPPGGGELPDGVAGTITGGPVAAIDLLEILSRSAACVTRGGAVSGAAHMEFINPEKYDGGNRRRAIALSDGSRISFASVAESGVLMEDDAGARLDA